MKTLYDCAALLKSWAAAGGFLSIALTVLYGAVVRVTSPPAWMSALAGFFQDLPGALPDFPAEWLLEAAWFLVLPAFLAVFSIELGSRLLAGREAEGLLELLLAYPISRRRLLLERYAVLVVATAGMVLVVWAFAGLGFLTAGGSFPGAGTLVELFLQALVFGSLAFAFSGRTGKRGQARIITLIVLGLAAALELAGSFIPAPLAFIQYFSPLADLAGSHLAAGFRPGFVLLLSGLAVFLVLLALLGFESREIE